MRSYLIGRFSKTQRKAMRWVLYGAECVVPSSSKFPREGVHSDPSCAMSEIMGYSSVHTLRTSNGKSGPTWHLTPTDEIRRRRRVGNCVFQYHRKNTYFTARYRVRGTSNGVMTLWRDKNAQGDKEISSVEVEQKTGELSGLRWDV